MGKKRTQDKKNREEKRKREHARKGTPPGSEPPEKQRWLTRIVEVAAIVGVIFGGFAIIEPDIRYVKKPGDPVWKAEKIKELSDGTTVRQGYFEVTLKNHSLKPGFIKTAKVRELSITAKPEFKPEIAYQTWLRWNEEKVIRVRLTDTISPAARDEIAKSGELFTIAYTLFDNKENPIMNPNGNCNFEVKSYLGVARRGTALPQLTVPVIAPCPNAAAPLKKT